MIGDSIVIPKCEYPRCQHPAEFRVMAEERKTILCCSKHLPKETKIRKVGDDPIYDKGLKIPYIDTQRSGDADKIDITVAVSNYRQKKKAEERAAKILKQKAKHEAAIWMSCLADPDKPDRGLTVVTPQPVGKPKVKAPRKKREKVGKYYINLTAGHAHPRPDEEEIRNLGTPEYDPQKFIIKVVFYGKYKVHHYGETNPNCRLVIAKKDLPNAENLMLASLEKSSPTFAQLWLEQNCPHSIEPFTEE